MEIINYLDFRKNISLITILFLSSILTSCFPFNSMGNPIWFDEIFITTNVDTTGKDQDSITEIEYGVDHIICVMSIRGSSTFQFPAAWYYEDELLFQKVVEFGEERQGRLDLFYRPDGKKEPIPSGQYRCEWGPISTSERSVEIDIHPSIEP